MSSSKAMLDRKIYSNSLKKLVTMKLLGQVIESPRARRLRQELRQQLTQRKKKVHQAINQLVQSRHKYEYQIDNVIKQLVEEKQLKVEMESFRKRHTFRNYRIKTEREALNDQSSEEVQENQEERQHSDVSEEKSIGRQGKQKARPELPLIRIDKRMNSQPNQLQRQVERQSLLKVAKHIRFSSFKNGELRLDLQRLKNPRSSRFKTVLQPQTELICLRSKGIPVSLK